MAEPTKKLIYNVELGKEVEYELDVDDNNEIVATYYVVEGDGEQENKKAVHFLKFPNKPEAEVDELIAQHNESAAKQVKKQPLFGKPVEEAKPDSEQTVS